MSQDGHQLEGITHRFSSAFLVQIKGLSPDATKIAAPAIPMPAWSLVFRWISVCGLATWLSVET
jgi:hypothetical protein